MIAFNACAQGTSNFSEDTWRASLQEGLYQSTCALPYIVIRECFPTATIAVMREEQSKVESLKQILQPFYTLEEVQAVLAYLNHGVAKVKKSKGVFDRADALVAALSALPYVYPVIFKEVERKRSLHAKWSGTAEDEIAEGRIAVIE